jgi:hydroxymethylpyrimidine/phosphomethylpyrimidine kinase
MQGRVLIVAGSDSSGGAGIQADIKTVTALRGYAAAAVTAVTAQSTRHVLSVHPVPAAFVAKQMEAVLSDIGADCIKTGMLHTAAVIEAVGDVIERLAPRVPLVVDPLMVAKGGERLLKLSAVEALKRVLLVRATVLTPNVPEAEALTGMTIRDIEDMRHAAEMVHTLGPKAVLLTGGHLRGNTICDVLHDENGVEVFGDPRIDTKHTHGTGCTLASGIATGLAQGLTVRESVARARAYVREAILSAPRLGKGHGPIDHTHTVRPFDVVS